MRPFPGAAREWSTPAGSRGRQRRSAVAALIGLPVTAHALGLGAAIGDSVLGETLRLEVPLTGSTDGPLDNGCVSIRRPSDPIEADYFPRDLAVRIDNAGGNLRLQLASRTAIRQPLVQFGIAVTCGYNLTRDYLIAVSPRGRTPAPATPAAAAAAKPSAAAPVGTSPAASAITPDGVPGRSVVLDRDMTLEALARRHFPGPLRQGRFMRWVAEANPQLFADSKDIRQQRLAAGTQVLIPEGVPPRRPGDYRNGSSPLDEFGRAGAEPTAKVGRAGARQAPQAKQDRLVVGSGGRVTRSDKETAALVQQLTAMLELQAAAQAANSERIQQLEAGTEQLKAQLAQIEASSRQREAQLQAQLQAQLHAAQRARDELAERAWWQMALAVLVGGALAAGLLQGYRLLAARRSEPEVPPLDAPQESSGATRPAPIGRGEVPAPAAVASTAVPRSTPAPVARGPKPILDPLDFEPPAFLQPETRRITTGDTTAIADVAAEIPDPAKAAIELANIMTSMGLTESAAQTLVDHIRENPRQSLLHWLKLLELHRLNGKREDYERSRLELRQHFNVQADDWHGGGTSRGTLEAYPHIRAQITRLWRDAGCVKYLHSLLIDNREGTRAGFPLSVAEEILLLIAIQSDVQ